MKIRTDFVTNSSSSSFIAVGIMNAELAEYVTILLNGENTGYAKNLIGCLNVNGSIVSVSAENHFASLHIDFTDAGVDSRNDRQKREDEKRVNTTQVICEMLRACLPGSTDEDERLFRNIVSSCVANHQTIAEVYNSETDEPYFETFTEWSFHAKHINDSGSSFGYDPLKHLKEVFPSWKAGIPFDHVATIVCEGKKFHLTGMSDAIFEYLKIRKRPDVYSAKSWVQAKKGIISETVTRACDYLIVGTRATVDSPQVAKAIQYRNSGKSNIKIIPEDELLRMLNGEVLEIPEEDQRVQQAREDAIKHAAEKTESFEAKEAADVAYTVCRVQTSEEIKRVLDVLRADEYKDSPSLEEMALIAGMTPETFRKRFSAEVGTSPKNYLIQCKMERAKALLRQQKYTVREVGAAVGIPDPYHFSKQFKSVVGVSPSDFGYSSALVTEESQPQVRHAVQETEPEQKKTESFEAKEAADAGYIVRRVQISEEIQRVLDVLRADEYKESPSLEEMALIAGMTPETFRKRFSAEMGTSPKNYLIQCKMERAKALLRQQKYTVREVGAAVGIPDPYHFSKQFKSVVGLSPSDFVNEEIRKMSGE